MSTLLWQIGFVMLAGLLIALLLRPALSTWRATRDEEPPAVRHEDPIEHLRVLVRDDLCDMLKRVRTHGGVARGMDLDGEAVLVLGARENLVDQIEPGTERIRFGVITVHRLDVPGEVVCERDLYAEGRASIAQSAVIRSLLGLGDVVIGVRARVMRRVHADGRLDVAEGAWLHGEASAGEAISLARRARFVNLVCPVIEFGSRVAQPLRPAGQLPDYVPPGAILDNAGKRLIVHGDVTVPAGHRVAGDMVVSGRLVILENCVVAGSVRAEKSVRVSRGTQIEGAIVSPSDVRLGDDCRVRGPLLAGTRLFIGGSCQIGSRHEATSVVASRMRIATGSVVYGSVRARQTGQVIAPQELQT